MAATEWQLLTKILLSGPMDTINLHTKFEHRRLIRSAVMSTTYIHTDIFSIPLFWAQYVPIRGEMQKEFTRMQYFSLPLLPLGN